MEVKLEATLEAEAQVESRLGRMVGMAVHIKDENVSPYIDGGGRRPKVLTIDETKFTVAGKE